MTKPREILSRLISVGHLMYCELNETDRDNVDQSLSNLAEIVREQKIEITGMTNNKEVVSWNDTCDYIAKLFEAE